MKKRIITVCVMSFFCYFFYGQALKKFEVREIENNGIHSCENREEFQAVFRCSNSIDLSFTSDVDDNIEMSRNETENDHIYYLNFPAKAKTYKNRVLTIEAKGFEKVNLTKFNFPNHKTVEYYLYNPYDIDNNPFYRYHAQGDSLLNKFNYTEAHTAYSRCKMFPEYKEEKNKRIIDRQIEKIDSICSWQKQGDALMDASRYKLAMEVYEKILDVMPSDRVVERNLSDCIRKFEMCCSEYMKQADMYYADKDFKKAKERYTDIINMGCTNAEMASTKIRSCDDKISSKLNHNKILLWEIGLKDAKDIPHKMLLMGLTIGNCKPKRGGGYWSIRSHMDATKLISSTNRKKEHGLTAEANMSVGGTGHIYAPGGKKPGLWYHIGAGYTGCGVDLDETSDKDRYKWKHAVSPEVGLIFKWTYFAMKYTFQYRGWISGSEVALQTPADTELKLSPIRHYLSIGVAW